MSVLMEFAMFPTDKGSSVSEYVSKVIKMIKESGVSYQLTPMGTIIETENMAESLAFLEKAHDVLSPHAERIYSTATFDIRKNKSERIVNKIASIEQKIGKVNH